MLQHLDTHWVQQFLDNLPAGLVLRDQQGHIVWANDQFIKMSGRTAVQLIGTPVGQLSDELQAVFSQDLVAVTRAGQDTSQYLACTSVAMGDYSLHYCHDITQLNNVLEECAQLRNKVAELDTKDAVTGLLNRRAMLANLEQQNSRSRRYGNLLSVMIIHLVNLDDYRACVGQAQVDALLLKISQTLMDQMRWADVIGRFDDNEFLLIMPETQEQAASELHGKISERLNKIPLVDDNFELLIEYGMAQWRKGDDLSMLMQRARRELSGGVVQKVAV
jgi:diguanylate cyclase (GGDEF)-like protein